MEGNCGMGSNSICLAEVMIMSCHSLGKKQQPTKNLINEINLVCLH